MASATGGPGVRPRPDHGRADTGGHRVPASLTVPVVLRAAVESGERVIVSSRWLPVVRSHGGTLDVLEAPIPLDEVIGRICG